MKQQMIESTERADRVDDAAINHDEAASAELAEKMAAFAQRVLNGERTADLFGIGDGFIDDAVAQAYQFYGVKSFDKAETLLRGVLALDATRAYPHLLLGDILLQKSDYGAAMKQFERAHELNPEDGEILAKLGEAKLRAGHADEANRFLLAAIDVLPSGSQHHKRSSVLQNIAQCSSRETSAAGHP